MDARLVVAGLVVLAGAAVAVAGASPQASLTPSKAVEAEAGPATVKGTVVSVDRDAGRFVLTDGQAELTVAYDGVLPTAVAANKTVVAEGTLEPGEPTILRADEIKVGCPSSYGG